MKRILCFKDRMDNYKSVCRILSGYVGSATWPGLVLSGFFPPYADSTTSDWENIKLEKKTLLQLLS